MNDKYLILTKAVFLFIILNFMFTPLIVLYTLGINIADFQVATISIYGLYIVMYLLIQVLFSLLNSYRMSRLPDIGSGSATMKYNILVVGYKENPSLFEKCLESVYAIKDSTLVNNIYIVIDGNEQSDMYMKDIFTSVFPSATVKVLEERPSSNSELIHTLKGELSSSSSRVYCILQPHKGKRHVLYTGLKLSCLDKDHVKGILCSDSDTILDINCIKELAKCLEKEDVGAVTGNLYIYNPYSFISYLTSLRYWLAFNLERGYQSFNGVVLCVSGPLGMYKTECIDTFIEPWLTQIFLGKECTYGDDRHLTNLVLSIGKKVVYNPRATCKTDAPEEYLRFFIQQVRWYKSSAREFLFSLKFIHKQSLWMVLDLIYQFVYAFIVIIALLYILFAGTFLQLAVYIYTIVIFNMIKGVYACILERDIKYILFSIYGLLYVSTLAPAKIYSILDIKDVTWGTTNRFKKQSKLSVNLKYIIFIVSWNLFIASGISYNIYRNYSSIHINEVISISFMLGFILMKCFIVLLLHRINKHKSDKDHIFVMRQTHVSA